MNADQQLVNRIADGDKQALADLYDRYHYHICQLVHRNGTSSQETEKVMADIFYKIWNSPHILEEEKYVSISITKLCLKRIHSDSLNTSTGIGD